MTINKFITVRTGGLPIGNKAPPYSIRVNGYTIPMKPSDGDTYCYTKRTPLPEFSFSSDMGDK